MNQTTAAQYINVSISTFKTHYRPYLKEYEDGGVVYFLKTDIERFCRSRFIVKTPAKPKAVKANKNKDAAKNDAFSIELAKFRAG
jgi:hypothetical protein